MSNDPARALRAVTALILCSTLFTANPVPAQSTTDDDSYIDEIIVTSRYRAEKLSDVPVKIRTCRGLTSNLKVADKS